MQRTLAETDPDIARAIQNETTRQAEGLELIASENFVSNAILEAAGSILTNKYADMFACAPECGCTLAWSALNSAVARSMASDSMTSTNSQPP